MSSTTAYFLLVGLTILVGPIRIALRLRQQLLGTDEAHKRGAVTCPHCGHTGRLDPYAPFLGTKRVLRCKKCRKAAG